MREVVEQNARHAGVEHGVKLLEILDLDLHGQALGVLHRLDRRMAHPAGQPLVVVLDQDPIVEPLAVIGAAAADDGVLFEDAEARRGLARVQDRDAAGRGIHELRGQAWQCRSGVAGS